MYKISIKQSTISNHPLCNYQEMELMSEEMIWTCGACGHNKYEIIGQQRICCKCDWVEK